MKYIFLLVIGSASAVWSQSLDSLIAEGLGNNPGIAAYAHKIQAANAGASAAGAWPAPSVGFEASQVPIASANLLGDAISNGFTVSQMIPLGGKTGAMEKAEQWKSSVTKDEFSSFKLRLRVDITNAYVDAWMASRQIEVQEELVALLKSLSETMPSRYASAGARQSDLLLLQAEIVSAEVELASLKRLRLARVDRLALLIGRNAGDTTIMVEKNINDTMPAVVAGSVDALIEARNPELRKMTSMAAMSNAEADAAAREMIPDLMVQGALMRMPNGMLLTANDPMPTPEMQGTQWMYSVMVSVTLPFLPWSRSAVTSREEQRRNEARWAELSRDEMGRRMKSDARAMLARAESAHERALRYEQSVIPLYKQASDASVSAFTAGTASITYVIDAAKMLLMEKMKWYMAVAEYRMMLADLELMVGTAEQQ